MLQSASAGWHRLHWLDFSGFRWPTVEVVTAHPVQACLASQYAGWPIKNGDLTAMGSGPGRAIIHQGSLYDRNGYKDYSKT
ncbi:MAG: hypothetical protein M0Z35_02275, partial [Desulfitobacterium hafniense]|nr:hypothetical protein [Desulfitobacterium hafniense]